MKTKVTAIGRLTGLAAAVALFAVATTGANAQEKGAAKLIKLNAPRSTTLSVASSVKAMSCVKCQDAVVRIPDTDIKGAGGKTLVSGGPPTKIVAKHLCGSCANEWVIKGHGKATVSVPVHKCASCG